MARLLADEHVPVNIVFRLRRLGHDVATVRELGEDKYGDGLEDAVVLALAKERRSALITKNVKDFRTLHELSANHFGIIACTFDDSADAKRIARMIDDQMKSVPTLRGKWLRVIDRRD